MHCDAPEQQGWPLAPHEAVAPQWPPPQVSPGPQAETPQHGWFHEPQGLASAHTAPAQRRLLLHVEPAQQGLPAAPQEPVSTAAATSRAVLPESRGVDASTRASGMSGVGLMGSPHSSTAPSSTGSGSTLGDLPEMGTSVVLSSSRPRAHA